jgi:nucleoside 2-deoxyribosyltransferase
MGKTIYFAAPLFTQAERMWNRKLSEIIRRKRKEFKVFLPQEEGKKAIGDGAIDFKKIQQTCLKGINSSDVILAILDGSDSDSGTCFECGYAYSQGKKIIGLRTDVRGGEDQGLNAMLNQSCRSVIRYESGGDSENDIDNLAELIIEEIERIG